MTAAETGIMKWYSKHPEKYCIKYSAGKCLLGTDLECKPNICKSAKNAMEFRIAFAICSDSFCPRYTIRALRIPRRAFEDFMRNHRMDCPKCGKKMSVKANVNVRKSSNIFTFFNKIAVQYKIAVYDEDFTTTSSNV